MAVSAELAALGFREAWLDELLLDSSYPARVARVEKSRAWLWSERGEHELDLALYPKPYDVTVGDWMLLEDAQGQVLPLRRLPRFSAISRRAAGERADEQLIAANIDSLFIVSSCNQDFSQERLERYLALALEAGVQPVVVLTKADLSQDAQDYVAQARALSPALELCCLNALDESAVQQLQRWCGPGHTVAMVGSSGVGKSTLTNQLIGEVVQQTQLARDEDAKGRHTTTGRSLHRLSGGGLIIDTPGMRELQLPGCEQGLEVLFADVIAYLGRCRFNDCQHQNEPGCAVQAAIEAGDLDARRWRSYSKLQAEQALNQQSMAERRASDKQLTRSYRQYQKQARGNKGRRS